MAAIWAHRGASKVRPENTLDAFAAARDLGADGVELDVRRTRDGAMAVHHDAKLADGRAIVDLEVGDLPPHVPLLEAALDACAGLLVNIEIKNVEVDVDHDPSEHLAGAVVHLLRDRPGRDAVLVSSFSLATIDRVRSLDPTIATGYLTSARWNQVHCLERAVEGGHAALHPMDPVVNAELVQQAHDVGLAVNTWTVDDPDRMRWLVDECGVDAVITNVPDLARATLG
jgi:glycerophosphoryl diester phosphodiesterase